SLIDTVSIASDGTRTDSITHSDGVNTSATLQSTETDVATYLGVTSPGVTADMTDTLVSTTSGATSTSQTDFGTDLVTTSSPSAGAVSVTDVASDTSQSITTGSDTFRTSELFVANITSFDASDNSTGFAETLNVVHQGTDSFSDSFGDEMS